MSTALITSRSRDLSKPSSGRGVSFKTLPIPSNSSYLIETLGRGISHKDLLGSFVTTPEQCVAEAKRLLSRSSRDYKRAIAWLLIGVQMFVDKTCANLLWNYTSGRRTLFSRSEREALEAKAAAFDDPVVTFFIGYVYYWGRCSFRINSKKAYKFFSKAAKMGHVYAIHYAGICLEEGIGTRPNTARSKKMMSLAADLSCVDSCIWAGHNYQMGYLDLNANYFQACRYFLKGTKLGSKDCRDSLASTLREHPLESSPAGDAWKRNTDVQALVHPQIHQSMLTWTLVAKRTSIFRDLARIVTRYITTHDGWESLKETGTEKDQTSNDDILTRRFSI